MAAIWGVISNLPEIIRIVKLMLTALEEGKHFIDVRIQLSAFDKAAEKAKNDKDTSALEGLFDPKPASGDSGNTSSH